MGKYPAEKPPLHLEDAVVHSESSHSSAQEYAVICQRSEHPHTHFSSRGYEHTQEWVHVSVAATEHHCIGVLSALQRVIPGLVSHTTAAVGSPQRLILSRRQPMTKPQKTEKVQMTLSCLFPGAGHHVLTGEYCDPAPGCSKLPTQVLAMPSTHLIRDSL